MHGYLVGQQDEDLLLGPDFDPDDEEDSWLDQVPDWDEDDDFIDDEIGELVEQFVASPHARRLPQDETTTLLAGLLMSMAVAAEGDPLHWCEQNVGWVLADALPRFPLLSEETLGDVPPILSALVSWAHEEVEEDAETTERVLAVTSELLADLPRRWATKEMEVGRLDAMTELAMLSDEPVTVPEDLHGVVGEIDAALVDGLAAVHADEPSRPAPVLDEEFLTACRRFLVQVAVGDPDVLRGRAKIGNTAAAIAWVVGRGNGLVGRSALVRSGELTRAFGVRSTPAQRAERLQEAALLPHAPEGEPPALGSPDLLVASARQEIRAEYEQLTAVAAKDSWLDAHLS